MFFVLTRDASDFEFYPIREVLCFELEPHAYLKLARTLFHLEIYIFFMSTFCLYRDPPIVLLTRETTIYICYLPAGRSV